LGAAAAAAAAEEEEEDLRRSEQLRNWVLSFSIVARRCSLLSLLF
jgi:hypothetical protein